ncbi:amylo-alpha-1,6-glucosidase [Streptomyces albus]|uniref:Amylo-alpha-1,6-glucosidase n=1 Tax=Streptomyces albus (strain ATCC 21838 / DSM 41398 / FERM P-419 / JCM 4703 / NBRC 107858) TaxID=1081613 RepID=A0A0B5EVC6_STRA4|nr:amylo-alpha-1,6-glucosidase [Streptomyces albus]AOU80057.1 amylo-alpha-1,6-glucosidase [Streptomyces albus]AYN35775.1 amylo-alpha-1,6-glucosidase [Streptomyces albus]
MPQRLRLELTADADFSDQFELRADLRTYAKPGAVRSREARPDGVRFGYRRGDWESATEVSATPAPDTVIHTGTGARRLVWSLALEPHAECELRLRVTALPHGGERAPGPDAAEELVRPTAAAGAEFEEGVHRTTRVEAGFDGSVRQTATVEVGFGGSVRQADTAEAECDGFVSQTVRPTAEREAAEDQPAPVQAEFASAAHHAATIEAEFGGSVRQTVSPTAERQAAEDQPPSVQAEFPGAAHHATTAQAEFTDRGAQTDATEAEFAAGLPLPDWPELAAACTRGLADLASLQVPAEGPDGEALRVPAAGVPWFLALLGRDALLTSLFALPYRPGLAAATLPALAAVQATADRGGAAAQPGKIVHEVRHGELAHFGQVPYGRYYGSVDATPLFLVLLGAYTEQTGDLALARRLEPHARAALTWMLDHGGLTSRGYLVYRADEGGLANQNWKDSPGAICSADGERPSGPVTAAAAQGYAYDALRRTAQLARTVWADEPYAAQLTRAAADLRDRFQRDFWMERSGFPALALDGEGHQYDALASDAGHLLWSGLLDKEYGEAVGRRLLAEDFFSGWGVRTLAAGQRAYHPLSRHRGSVWPHDNALIALGLARYGLHDEARAVATALVEAAATDGFRLPAVLAGYPRGSHPAPVPCPHACLRESRSAAAPLALLTAIGGA